MVVADTILVPSRRPRRLDTPKEAPCDEDAEGVVHRLMRDRPDLRSDELGHAVGGDVRLTSHCAQHRQSLSGHLNAALAKEMNGVGCHTR